MKPEIVKQVREQPLQYSIWVYRENLYVSLGWKRENKNSSMILKRSSKSLSTEVMMEVAYEIRR